MLSHTLHECYHAIRRASASRSGPRSQGIDYAATYAGHGLLLPDAASSAELTDESRVQALYVRSNLSGWRGEEASAVRRSLDIILKGAS